MKKILAISAVALALSACDKAPESPTSTSDSPVAAVDKVDQKESKQALRIKHVVDAEAQLYVDKLYEQADEHMKDVLSTINRSYTELNEIQQRNSKQVAINELHRDTKSGEWSAVIDFLDTADSVKVPVSRFDSVLVNGIDYEIVKSDDGKLYAMQKGFN